ncbi:MAG: hypothetical protein KGM16_15510 [Bacteroidota bacterium]|nr:hypothetical protein [Bacteroidota bacterium]
MKLFKLSFWLLLIATVVISCGKEYSSEQLRPATGSWEFSNGGINYSGYLDTVYQTIGVGSNVLYILGKTDDGSQYFQLKLYGNSFTPGTYYATQYQNSFSYNLPAKTIYTANALIGEFVVNLNVLDSAKIQGTFSGTAKDSANNLIQITNGKFNTY